MLKSICLYVCILPRQVPVTLFGLGSWAPVTVPFSGTLANGTGVGRVAEAVVFQPLIPQNYSSDQAGSALHGCRGHTTQPRGQPTNYRPLCPPSLSPLGRWGNEGKEPERRGKKRESIDLNIKRSTVSITSSLSVVPKGEECEGLVSSILITPFPALRQRKKPGPEGPQQCHCVWIYISAWP